MADGMRWRTPTIEEARLFAQCIEACLPGEVAIGCIDPEIIPDVRVELARRWEDHPQVRAARFDCREWIGKSVDERRRAAMTKTRNGMAAFLIVRNIAELKDHELNKALKFVDSLEKVEAGTAGQTSQIDDFFNRFQQTVLKQAKGQKETVQ